MDQIKYSIDLQEDEFRFQDLSNQPNMTTEGHHHLILGPDSDRRDQKAQKEVV